ncbi:MAG TPA: AAA family ATPase, partial [Candidatus Paceibacterota bacterium]
MTQSDALEILKMGKNVFLTGPAGSGKTFVLNSYIKYLKSHAVDVAITASTGIAATHIGGQTIHSWSGLGIRDNLTEYELEELLEKQYLYKRFEKTKVLVIDEISMLDSERLDLVDWVCRSMKRNSSSFGGIQIIVCGDFFQLPPISRNSTDAFGENIKPNFSYKADSWSRAKFTVCYIEEQHRQKDKTYLSILNEIRSGSVKNETVKLLLSRINKDIEQGKEFT